VRRAGFLIDGLCVLVFVAIGRGAHTDGVTIAGMASTAWPFLGGLALGAILCGVVGKPSASVLVGVIDVVTTVAIGMGLRVLAGQGTAVAFVVVAVCFLGLAMVGWRLVCRRLAGRSPRAAVNG
jgi:hypothetical protein